MYEVLNCGLCCGEGLGGWFDFHFLNMTDLDSVCVCVCAYFIQP